MSIWKALERKMDAIVDQQFAEPVEIHPWKKASTGGYSNPGAPDPDRPVLNITGIYVNPGASITGEGGTQGANLNVRMVTQDVWLSVIEDYIGDVKLIKPPDRVFFPERGEWFEVAYSDPSATNRPNIHLIRLQDSSL